MNSSPFVLFIPAYGQGGTGELMRCITLATAVLQRWPAARIEFLLPQLAGAPQAVPFTSHRHTDDGSTKEQFNNRLIEHLQPQLVVFDGGIRPSAVRRCRALGIHCAYVSFSAQSQRKAFRLASLRQLDAHWHQRSAPGDALPVWLQLLERFSSTRRRVFDTCLATPPADQDDLPAVVHALLAAPYVLLTPGGGGYRIDGRSVGSLYVEVAERVHAATGVACLTVLGPLGSGAAHARATATLSQVSPGRMVALMRAAQLVVCNGGGTLTEAVACGTPVVAAALGGTDQVPRIAAYAAAGRVQTAEATIDALTAQALALLDPVRNAQQRQRLGAARMVDGIPLMVDAMAELLNND